MNIELKTKLLLRFIKDNNIYEPTFRHCDVNNIQELQNSIKEVWAIENFFQLNTLSYHKERVYEGKKINWIIVSIKWRVFCIENNIVKWKAANRLNLRINIEMAEHHLLSKEMIQYIDKTKRKYINIHVTT